MANLTNLSLEERTHLLAGAESFTSYVAEKWPQINEEGEVNYYFSGSLAVMLLAQADSIELLDPQYFPKIRPYQSISVPQETKAKLSDFARKIGDLDFVTSPNYQNLPYEKRLKKGGGGPSIEELPELAKETLEIPEGMIKVMCDPVEHYGEHQVARIEVKGRQYLISDPRLLFGYKVLHLLQSLDNKPDKIQRDFGILHRTLSQLFTEDELVKTAYGILFMFEDRMHRVDRAFDRPGEFRVRGYMQSLDMSPHFNATIRPFFEKLKAYDVSNRNIM